MGRAPAASGGRPRVRHALAGVAAAVLGLGLVALVFVRVDLRGGLAIHPRFDAAVLRERLPVHAGWLAPFAGLAALLPALRALVWRAMLPAPPPRPGDVYHATALGALAHNALPGKLGPLAAAWILARTTHRPFTPAFASQLAAKLLEVGAVVVLGALGALGSGAGGAVGRVVTAGAVLFAVLAAAAAGIALGAAAASARLARRFPRAGAAVAALGEGVGGAGSPGRLAAAIALAFLPALTASAAYTLPLRAAGAGEGLGGGAVLLAVLTFGQLTPGLPIGTGVYWSLAAWAARELGAPPADAAATAVLSHAAMVGANLAVGSASALVRRGALRDVLRRRRELARLASRRAAAPPRGSPRAPTS